ncbi:saccharopine dehydrogenase NADP-binding domain-containing protein [Vitiosangium sp. GDMCC 1.1324]|uniref:saccharopine dehydrogenase NADP-binding domain-containing protein n=1 Tax=Vitiosangium sp. (strain GDMCC 1.1324) TaxID=2138576 RepID=UPI000D362C66|nr:saccharopine dehydrogenase NADP-binding domain-containing protein [Vitiosangium sp. GDMCC 1.1324]PTL85307.1 saccharopine dehydrogenase [Vitiosangium sp. GDMCC 1.1324]
MRDVASRRVGVYGATGHTGRFVVNELRRRGWVPVRIARSPRRHDLSPEAEVRVAAIDDDSALDRALSDVSVIINCAGPFLDTADAIVRAALRTGAHYLDVTAEQLAAKATLEQFANAAAAAGVVVAPAFAFYGGLADLLATAAMGEWRSADEITVAVALDSWWPTHGTRLTGKRNTARRFGVADGATAFVPDPPPRRSWAFPEPFDTQEVIELPFSEIVTIASHLRARDIHSYINLAPIADIRNPDTPTPRAADESGRSAQTFVMDVVVKNGNEERRATARGRDIYAFTAPLVVEAATRLVDGQARRTGTAAPGALFDARDFLASLAHELVVTFR